MRSGRTATSTAAANNLNQAVHAARKALGAAAVELQDGLLRLDADVDVEAFELAAAAARRDRTAAACERALALYGGELLPENRYDDWAELERGRLAAIHGELEQILDDLGVVPGRRRLPLETSTFVGREHELAELTDAARAYPPAHAGRHRRCRQDTARARARARTRGRACRRRDPRRARFGRRRLGRSGRRRGGARPARAPGARACWTRSPRTSLRASCCSCSTTAST